MAESVCPFCGAENEKDKEKVVTTHLFTADDKRGGYYHQGRCGACGKKWNTTTREELR